MLNACFSRALDWATATDRRMYWTSIALLALNALTVAGLVGLAIGLVAVGGAK